MVKDITTTKHQEGELITKYPHLAEAMYNGFKDHRNNIPLDFVIETFEMRAVAIFREWWAKRRIRSIIKRYLEENPDKMAWYTSKYIDKYDDQRKPARWRYKVFWYFQKKN